MEGRWPIWRLGKLGEQVVPRTQAAFDRLQFMDATVADARVYYSKRVARDAKAKADFRAIESSGVASTASCYVVDILREADISAFVVAADEIMRRSRAARPTRLKALRKAAGYTQRALSKKTGVSLRMIQLYEQRQNNINRAEAVTVANLARALNCDVVDLLEP